MGSNLDHRDQKVARHVKDEFGTLEQLFTAAEAVEALQAHPGWIHVTRIVDMEIAEIDRDLDRGTVPLTQAEYAMAHGRRGGLRGAKGAADAIVSLARVAHEQQRQIHERAAESALEGS